MKFFIGLLILMILVFMGMFYYRFCKKIADKLVHAYLEGRDQEKNKS